MGFGDILDYNWDIEIPGPYSFIIGGCYKSSILIHESDCVDGTQMLVIFLRDLTRVHVVLSVDICQPNAVAIWNSGADLYDLLV